MGSPTKTVSYRYDSRGNRSALIDHDGGRTSYTYDVMNRLASMVNPQAEHTTYSYDAAGRRTVKKLANGTRASFTYDAAGNLTKLYNLKSDGSVIGSFDYAHDKVGNRTAVLESGGSRVTWSYDNGYQLTGEHRTGSNPYRDTYTYDPVGSRLLTNHDGARTTFAYDAANQLTYSQDASGRTTFTFDADGNQQVVREPSGNRTTYAWDYENRMTVARLPAGVRNTMAYDADGLRVKLEESTGTKKFVWDDQNYLGETDAANDTQVVYTNEPRLYGNLVSQRRVSTSHWYHFDALGSTRQLTDISAVVTDTRLYDAWGQSLATTGSTVAPLRWVGRVGYYFDSQTGLYYVRARMYEPQSSQWASFDPLWMYVGDSRFYTYAGARPIFNVDPSGLLHQTTVLIPMRIGPAVVLLPSCFYGECGVYSWLTQWILSAREQNGVIIQVVDDGGTQKQCDKDAAPTPVTASQCRNTARCKTYAEMWTVVNGVIAPEPTDFFGHPGFLERSKGDVKRTGDAFFVQADDVARIGRRPGCSTSQLFRTESSGAQGACNLPSVCFPNRPALRCLDAYREAGQASTTKKSADRIWNCCPCEDNTNKLLARIDGVSETCSKTT